jgi:hypothetical protein
MKIGVLPPSLLYSILLLHHFALGNRSLQQSEDPFANTGIDILYLKSEIVDNPPYRAAVSAITGGTTDFF